MGRSPAFAGGVDLLSLLSATKQRLVLEGSTRAEYRAGTVAFRPGLPARSFVVEKGLVRAFVTDRDGREATVALLHSGNLVGARNLVRDISIQDDPSLTSMQAVVDSTFLMLDVNAVRRLASVDIDVINAIATHLAVRVHYDLQLIAVRSLGTVSERLAFDLLDRASRMQLIGGRLELRATQEELAFSIGSSREVVGRNLKDLRAARIIETLPGRIRIIDPIRLSGLVRAIGL